MKRTHYTLKLESHKEKVIVAGATMTMIQKNHLSKTLVEAARAGDLSQVCRMRWKLAELGLMRREMVDRLIDKVCTTVE